MQKLCLVKTWKVVEDADAANGNGKLHNLPVGCGSLV